MLENRFLLLNYFYLWARLRLGPRRGSFMTFAVMAFSLFIVLLVLIFFSGAIAKFVETYFPQLAGVVKKLKCVNDFGLANLLIIPLIWCAVFG